MAKNDTKNTATMAAKPKKYIVRLSKELHEASAEAAAASMDSLNSFTKRALRDRVKKILRRDVK